MSLSIGCVTISFNQGAFLRECIESVQCSDRRRLSHVVVDPGSQDDSRKIIEEYAQKGRFHSVILEPDKGPGDGLNKGFARLGACDILCYLNSDDRFVQGALDWVLQYFESHPDVDVLTGAINVIDREGNRKLRKRMSTDFTPEVFLSGASSVMQPATFFRRSRYCATNGFNPANRTCWDTELLIDLMLAGAKFRAERKLLGDFRYYSGTISHGLISEGPQRKYRDDLERLRSRLITSGHPAISGPKRFFRYWSFRLSPMRRITECLIR